MGVENEFDTPGVGDLAAGGLQGMKREFIFHFFCLLFSERQGDLGSSACDFNYLNCLARAE